MAFEIPQIAAQTVLPDVDQELIIEGRSDDFHQV